ncbi:MAG: hypothetical protein PHE67_07910 [Campylobacterales bacterium]|nr:hypothetical protein [Campylobacterales bacterium]
MAKNKYANSGVHSIAGFELQKHIALFLILENFNDWESKNYFLYFEHYDDFLFCFVDNSQVIESIEMYQSKKNDSDWTLTELKPTIEKMLESLMLIDGDTHPKTDQHQKIAHFASNKTINLTHGKKKNLIKSDNEFMKFSDLDREIQNHIKSIFTNPAQSAEIVNLAFRFIDLNQKPENQKNALSGMLSEIVGDKIDSKAAVETLLSLFRAVETNFNQGNRLELSDVRKRVSKQKINDTMNIITTQKKAFELWRSKADEIAKAMKIFPLERKEFSDYFNTSFDLFKDLNQVEHIKIYKFVKSQINKLPFFTGYECLQVILENFDDTEISTLAPLQKKAAIFASYVELIGD